jgi:membrane protein implicated in regulation of membrane protease activity
MPYGAWINQLPTSFFLVVHIAAFAVGAGFAWLAFKRELNLLGGAFSLFALAEVVYMTYHLDWTVFLFAHTIAEVLDLGAFVLVFSGAVAHVWAQHRALGARGA